MHKIILKLKRLLCKHDFDNEFVGRRFADGIEYLLFVRTCKKCSKKRGVIARLDGAFITMHNYRPFFDVGDINEKGND